MVERRAADNARSPFLDAREAAAFLDVKLATVYAYAARGLLRPISSGRGRARLYARGELELLRARHDARSGHGPVAASALRYGEPVLESALTAIDAEGPRYRGRSALALAADAVPFESVAELLWTGDLPAVRPVWPASWLGPDAGRIAAMLAPKPTKTRADAARSREPTLFAALSIALPIFAAADTSKYAAPLAADLERARSIVRRLAASLALSTPGARDRARAAIEQASVAASVGIALGRRFDRDELRLVERALVMSADHELNPSSFAARVAASTGADLYACVAAALATASGPRHGGACWRVEALVSEAGRPTEARAVVEERARRGENVPGFGHPLYPAGDPRARFLLQAVRDYGAKEASARTLFAVIDAMAAMKREPPTVDLGLVATAYVLRLPPGAATAIFAIGRAAGWIAHALEQRSQAFLVRPRARYVG